MTRLVGFGYSVPMFNFHQAQAQAIGTTTPMARTTLVHGEVVHVAHHSGAYSANVSTSTFGVYTVSKKSASPVGESLNTAIDAALSQYASAEFCASVSKTLSILASAKVAAKTMQSGLFAGFLALVNEGADASVIRATGNAVRAAVTKKMRLDAGFSEIKAKGAKEENAPVFSTATAYSSLIAKLLDCKRENPSMFKVAIDGTLNETEVPATLADCGFLFDGVSANKRLQAQYDALDLADKQVRFPALYPQAPASLEQQLAQAHIEAKTLREELQLVRLQLANLKAQQAQPVAVNQ